MTTYFKEGVIISQSQSDSNRIRDIVHGTVVFADFGSIGADGGVASASGVAMGVQAGMNVLVIPQSWPAAEGVFFAAAIGIDNGIRASAVNPVSAAVDPALVTATFFAWR